MKTVGFATGVFDMMHDGHFNFLKAARDRCDYLIIGLTTDERCKLEKRKPVMPFAQRRSILMNCKWVDVVVENTGQTKPQMYDRLKFHVLFTTDEYIDRPEFTSFRGYCPDVPVIALPITSGVRTTEQIQRIENDILSSVTTLAKGTSGSVLMMDRRDSKTVLKPICIGVTEAESLRTSNCYHMPMPPPRNIRKLGEPKNFPNITAVNSYREIDIHKMIMGKSWNPTLRIVESYRDRRHKESLIPVETFQHVNDERKMPIIEYWIHQKYCGPTLREWIASHREEDLFVARLKQIIRQLATIIREDLQAQGTVHGDAHCDNVCIDAQDQVYLIDFGWCLHGSFHMVADEYQYWQDCLSQNFDTIHFIDSMLFDFGTEPWIHEVLTAMI